MPEETTNQDNNSGMEDKEKKDLKKDKEHLEDLINNLDRIQLSLNTEKWPIFTSSFNKHTLPRVYSEEALVDGIKVIRKVSVGKKGDKSDLTQIEFKIYAIFCHLWEQQGRPWDEENPDSIKIYFSISECLKMLGLSAGKSDYEWFEEKLLNCRSVLITFENAFFIAKDVIETHKRPVTILSDLSIYKRDKDGSLFDDENTTHKKNWAVIHPAILRNLVEKVHKPLLFNVYNSFRFEVTKMIYRPLDAAMFGIRVGQTFNKDLVDFAKETGLQYDQQMWALKKSVIKGLEELIGKPITSGVILTADIVESESKSGWKVIVTKGKSPKIQPENSQEPSATEKDSEGKWYSANDPEMDYFLDIYNKLPTINEQERIQKLSMDIFMKEMKITKLPEIIHLSTRNLYLKKALISEGYTYK